MIKAIFWDNDGILVDTEKYYMEATNSVLNKFGIELSEKDFYQLYLSSSKSAWHLTGVTDLHEIELLRKQRNATYNTLLKSNNLIITNVVETLEHLKDKYMMAIVTSSRKEHFNTIHRNTDLLKYFSFCLTREDYINSKPNPEPYLKALKKSGFLKDECIIIEDSERGVKAANNAGIRCIAIPYGLSKHCDFSTADFIVNSISEINNILDEL